MKSTFCGYAQVVKKIFTCLKSQITRLFRFSLMKTRPLVCGKYNIQEPVRKCSDSALNLDIVFIPAVCADKSGYRIGYGKGYYDRFLGKLHEKTKTAIVIYEELLCEKIPAENFDRKANFVITPEKIIKC